MKGRVFREEPAKAEKQAGYGGPQETQRRCDSGLWRATLVKQSGIWRFPLANIYY